MIYRNLPHDVMKVSLNELLFGSSLRLFGLPPSVTHINPQSLDSFPPTHAAARGVLVSHMDRQHAVAQATLCR